MPKEQKTGFIISFFIHFLIIFSLFILCPYTKRDIEGSIRIIAIENLPEEKKQESQDIKTSLSNHDNNENQINHSTDNLIINNPQKQVKTEPKIEKKALQVSKPKIIAKKTVQKIPEKNPEPVLEKSQSEKMVNTDEAENKISENENTLLASNKIILSEKKNEIDITQNNDINFNENGSKNINVASLKSNTLLETEFGRSGAPNFLNRVSPKYPMLARRLGAEGVVKLKLFIDEKGNLTDIKVVNDPGNGLTEAAIDAIKKSTFSPAMQNSINVSSVAILNINFRLNTN